MEISALSDIELLNHIRDKWNKIVLHYMMNSQLIKNINFRTKYTDEYIKRFYIAPGQYYLNHLYNICRPANNIIIENDMSITFKYDDLW